MKGYLKQRIIKIGKDAEKQEIYCENKVQEAKRKYIISGGMERWEQLGKGSDKNTYMRKFKDIFS